MPALPGPAALQNRQGKLPVSAVGADWAVVDGADYSQALPSGRVGVVSAPLLRMSPGFPIGSEGMRGLSYALFEFDLNATIPESEIRAVFETPLPAAGTAFVGLANFAANRWDWFTVPADGGPIAFGGLQSYKSVTTGRLCAAVALSGADPHTLSRVRLGQPAYVGDRPMPEEVRDIAGPQSAVEFDLSTYRVAGSRPSFDFDWESDGTLDLAMVFPDMTVSHAYAPGDTVTTLYYNDDEGNSSELTMAVSMLAGTWETYTIDGDPVAFNCSQPRLGVIAGEPALFYLSYDVEVNRWSTTYKPIDPADPQAGTYVPVDDDSPAVNFSDLVEVNGTAAIAFTDIFDDIKYYRALTVDGSSWMGRTAFVGVGADSTVDLNVVAGNPAVVCCSATWSDVYYRRASTGDGSEWPGEYGYAGSVGAPTEVALDSNGGLPMIVHKTATGVEVLRGVVPSGEGTWDSVISMGGYPGDGSLDLGYYQGRPMVVNVSTTGGQGTAWFNLSADESGGHPWSSTDIVPSDGSDRGHFCDYAELNTHTFKAVAAFRSETSKALEAAVFGITPAFTMVSAASVVDDSSDCGSECQVVVVNRVPLIAYEDRTSKSVKVAVMR